MVMLTPGRSPHGERGLKCLNGWAIVDDERRSPHGERGLKSVGHHARLRTIGSLSSRRAWIEMK